jgi:glycosyltransferase involved in cell wall biosynthesis
MQDWQAQYPQLANRRLLVLAGRITRLKGQPDFIRLIGALRQEFPDIHGLIVGEADARHQPYLAELKAAVEAQGLAEHITFTGHRADLREIFGVSALVLSLSTQPEAFGRTVLEALALGVPVVAHATGGVEEQLAAMFPAGMVRPGDQPGLLAACTGVLRDGLRPAALPGKFILDHMLESTLATYEEMAAARMEGEHRAYVQ